MKYDITQLGIVCDEGLKYYEICKTSREAWDNCPRGDWMLWIAAKLKIDEKLIFKAKGLCAKTVEQLMKDEWSKTAVQAAFDYSDGKITEEQLRSIAVADIDNDDGADDDDPYAAAYGVAAYAVDNHECTVASTADLAAYAAAAAAYNDTIGANAAKTITASTDDLAADSADIARKKNQKQTADICRDILTDAVFEKIIENIT